MPVQVRMEVNRATSARAHFVAQMMDIPVREVYQEYIDLSFLRYSPEEIMGQMKEYRDLLNGINRTWDLYPSEEE